MRMNTHKKKYIRPAVEFFTLDVNLMMGSIQTDGAKPNEPSWQDVGENSFGAENNQSGVAGQASSGYGYHSSLWDDE